MHSLSAPAATRIPPAQCCVRWAQALALYLPATFSLLSAGACAGDDGPGGKLEPSTRGRRRDGADVHQLDWTRAHLCAGLWLPRSLLTGLRRKGLRQAQPPPQAAAGPAAGTQLTLLKNLCVRTLRVYQ